MFFPGVVAPSNQTILFQKRNATQRARSNVEDSRKPMPARPSAPTPDMNNKEMGMTEERQREIQASLFRMLGQADDIPSSPPSKSTSSISKSSQTSDGHGVEHASTFPPRGSSSPSTNDPMEASTASTLTSNSYDGMQPTDSTEKLI